MRQRTGRAQAAPRGPEARRAARPSPGPAAVPEGAPGGDPGPASRPASRRAVAQRLGLGLAAAGAGLGSKSSRAGAALLPEETLTIKVFKRATPGVVFITNLAGFPDAFSQNTIEVPQGAGSGFIWDRAGNEGYVVTNYHVIREAKDVQVTLENQRKVKGKVVGFDEDRDVAVLKITVEETETLPKALKRSASKKLDVGQKVFAIGNPFGLDHTLTTGVISGTGREINSAITGRPIEDVIQTDCAINPGNSGGPLLDSSSEVVGINTAIYSTSGQNSGVGFAIPIRTVEDSVEEIIRSGTIQRPVIGIKFAPDGFAEQLGIKGVLVLNLIEGGAAQRAGIEATTRDDFGRLVLGDTIVELDGQQITNSTDLFRYLNRKKVGEEIQVVVLRGNQKETVMVELGKR